MFYNIMKKRVLNTCRSSTTLSNITYKMNLNRSFGSSHSLGPWTEQDEKEIQIWGSKQMSPVSLNNLMETGRGDNIKIFNQYLAAKNGCETVENSKAIMMQIACFLHREVPLRLAQRACELQSTSEFQAAPHVQKVANMYKESFKFLRSLDEPTTLGKHMYICIYVYICIELYVV